MVTTTALPTRTLTRIDKVLHATIEPPAITDRVRLFFDHFMRIPADVAVAVSACDVQLESAFSCLLATTVRQHLLATLGRTYPEMSYEFLAAAGMPYYSNAAVACAKLYGGDENVWDAIYHGVAPNDVMYEFVSVNGKRVAVPKVTDHYKFDTFKDVELAWLGRIQVALELGL